MYDIMRKMNLKFNLNQLIIQIVHLQNSPAGYNLEPHLELQPKWGGWSVLSRNGKIDDGWFNVTNFLIKKHDKIYIDRKTAEKYNCFPEEEYITPTKICKGELLAIVNTFKQLKLFICRVRVLYLNPNSKMKFHIDTLKDDSFRWRFHIPVITNNRCYYEVNNENQKTVCKMKNKNNIVYFVNTAYEHRAVNLGNTKRIHIVGNILYDSNFNKLPFI